LVQGLLGHLFWAKITRRQNDSTSDFSQRMTFLAARKHTMQSIAIRLGYCFGLCCWMWGCPTDYVWGQGPAASQSPSAAANVEIVKVLELQTAAWNRGDILEFMETYWKDDRLTFSGGGTTMRGWQATLERYQKSYPREKMGQLRFDQIECELLAPNAALVLGSWHLDIQGERKNGNFSLVLRKFDGRWLIIHDHSSTLVEKE
jgi:beta-aspartyl-peptidase (threonine type)